MAIRNLLSSVEGEKRIRITHILGIALIVVLFALSTNACSSSGEGEGMEPQDETAVLEEGKLAFEGTVKLAYGKYLYIPDFQGFDIVIQGEIQGGDLASLVGKEVKGIGEFSPERPSILIADTLEIKDDAGIWTSVFTRMGESSLADYLDLSARNDFVKLEDLSYDKKDDWEAQEMAKVYGTLEEAEDGMRIAVMDADRKEVGKVIVDNISEFSEYYVKKLSLFDQFWFYLTVGETVDWAARRRTREMFHAEVVFAGLF